MTGMAVEVSAMTLTLSCMLFYEPGSNASEQVDVTIADPELCSRYLSRGS